MAKLKTKSGFEFDVQKESFNDWRLLDALMTLDDKSATDITRANAMRKALNILLGETQKDRLYKHVADQHNGKVKPEDINTEFMDIVSLSQGDKKK